MLDEIAKESSEEKKPPGHRPAPSFCLNFGARIATSPLNQAVTRPS